MRTESFRGAAAFAAVLSTVPVAAAQSFDFALDGNLSTTSLSSTLRITLPGSAIGTYDATANPTGTSTCTNLFGSCNNTAIDMDIAVVGDTQFRGAPAGGFRATVDTAAGVVLISDLSVDALGGQAGVTDITLELTYPTFRTTQPNSLYIGGFTLPIPFGQVQVTNVHFQQTGGVVPGLVTPTGVADLYDVTALVPSELTFDLDVLGTPSSVGPLAIPLPLIGSLDLSGAAPLLTLFVDQKGNQTVPDPLPGQSFEDVPLDLPTIIPPGDVAHLVLDLTVQELLFDYAAHLSWSALGAPTCEVTSYCSSGPNTFSSGGHASASGSSSLTLNQLTLIATDVPPSHAGRFTMGSAQDFTPFGDGHLCVGGTVRRYPIRFADAAGVASYTIDFTDPTSSAALIAPGSTWNFQFVFRDPLGGPLTFNTTDAVSITFCP